MLIEGIITSVTGAWLVIMCFIMTTRNISSAIVFKVVPFFLGISCLVVGARLLGILK